MLSPPSEPPPPPPPKTPSESSSHKIYHLSILRYPCSSPVALFAQMLCIVSDEFSSLSKYLQFTSVEM
ncbi:unnamed protein product [Onchocerca ochengi]|uniref:Ovule protein n=1 Tax=Onchocerca ochengi TaxID=42157 RepID=A0A182EIU4_ONCOC|nr:unnamed protein product [Onchocerca ochengi]VDM91417.1 unnamed protein product [Onchocerca ochengi]